jgi:hypothetical protein
LKINNQTCWICGDNANSREHKIKKSDIEKVYGKGSYKGENELCLVSKGKVSPFLGSNSKIVKYDKVICEKCNNATTQPFDKAYEKFIAYIDENEDEILHKRYIDFLNIYQENLEESLRNLFKYFIKKFGCRLAHFGHQVPVDLIEILNGESYQTDLSLSFAVNEDYLILYRQNPKLFKQVGNGNLYGDKKAPYYFYSETYKWLNFIYYYDYLPDGNFGSTWMAERFAYIGSF